MKTPIVYYGGKTSMLPEILPRMPEHTCYTEVFFGGGSVFWAKPVVKNETINDTLDIVVNFYQQLKTNFAELKKLVDASCFARSLHDKALLILRNKAFFTPVELAWAFWFASNLSYGNKIGGGIKHSNEQSLLPPENMVRLKSRFTDQLVDRIEHTHIENRDALQVLESRNVTQAFHYIDPPYPGADQGHYKGYTWESYELLLTTLEGIKGKFMLSNYNSPLLTSYVEKNGWWQDSFKVNNKGMRKNDLSKIETLVCNYQPSQQQLNFNP